MIEALRLALFRPVGVIKQLGMSQRWRQAQYVFFFHYLLPLQRSWHSCIQSSSVTAEVKAKSITSVFLDECLHMFFVRFIPTFPILHRATFVFRECTHPLLLNAIAIGSLYLGPKDSAAKVGCSSRYSCACSHQNSRVRLYGAWHTQQLQHQYVRLYFRLKKKKRKIPLTVC